MGLDEPLQLVGRHVGLLAGGSAEVAAEAEEVAVLLPLDLHVGPTGRAGRAEELSAEVVVAPLADGPTLMLSDHCLDRVEELGLDDRLVFALVLFAVPTHDAHIELVGEEAMHLRDGGDRARRRPEPVVGHEVAELADRQLAAAEDVKRLPN
ncbi:MAG TPA: hypothetical protein VHJ99_11325 [Candidatus Dormibacteraeota bacterium]|nr:hypothetical protein [Candidatus Dormibacteraeota bacterium]